jgi:hypothetical protein
MDVCENKTAAVGHEQAGDRDRVAAGGIPVDSDDHVLEHCFPYLSAE